MIGKLKMSLQARETLDAYIGLLPFLLGFVIFTAGPLIYSFYLSFTSYDILTPPRWRGLDNYDRMATGDDTLWQSLRVTVIYTMVAVPVQVVVGYGMALMLNLKVRGLSFWRTAFYMPAVVPAMAVAYVFSWMLQSDVGLLNQTLRSIGIPGPEVVRRSELGAGGVHPDVGLGSRGYAAALSCGAARGADRALRRGEG